MSALVKHLPALIFYAIGSAFLGALAAAQVIPGHTALLVWFGLTSATGLAIGVKYGATATTAPVVQVVPTPIPVGSAVQWTPTAPVSTTS